MINPLRPWSIIHARPDQDGMRNQQVLDRVTGDGEGDVPSSGMAGLPGSARRGGGASDFDGDVDGGIWAKDIFIWLI